jgi:hypothetical protein
MIENSNPLLAGIKLPGRIFQLPSRGIFYKNGELADNISDGEIHVHSMSAMDEIVMKNPDQLFSGDAINTVFKNCISGIQKPSDLLAKDVDAIILFLRVVTYGSGFEFTAAHNCPGAKSHTYIADVDKLIAEMKMIDPTTVRELYTLTLDNGQTVKLRPNIYQHVLNLIKLNQNKKVITAEDQQQNLLLMLLSVIESVDGIAERALIEEWLKKIPAPMISRIGEKVEKVNEWGSDSKWKCRCRDCGQEYDVEIPVNPVSFFTE